jgi:hypothetical protein
VYQQEQQQQEQQQEQQDAENPFFLADKNVFAFF